MKEGCESIAYLYCYDIISKEEKEMYEDTVKYELEKRGVSKERVEDALDKNKDKAQEVLGNEEETNKLLKKAVNLCEKLSRIPIIGQFFNDVPLVCMMISDYVHGEYRDVPLATIITLVGAVIYFVNPFDIIPDAIPIVGQLDDAVAIGLALKAAHGDIMAYAEWKAAE